MNKDIIYIDTEDDITAIIGRIKASKDKIVALVPPKRTGVLQSAVNLRLLARIANNSNKHLVIVTNNKALIALSAVAKIPVAKTLQSKPEIAEIDALEVDDGEDIINGANLPVGELVKTTDRSSDEVTEEVIETINIDDEAPQSTTISSFKSSKISNPSKNTVKVPDFSRFRKKLFIGVFGVIILIIFGVWATQFAPSATIVITAKTEMAPVSMALNLGGTAATDVSKNIVQTVTKQIKKDVSIDFTATGKQKLGDKATGTMTLSNADSSSAINVPAGSIFSQGSYDFVTANSVNVPGASVVGGKVVAGSVTTSVTAADVGAEYNLMPGAYLSSVDGVTAYGNQMAGGSSRQATVVTADDIQKASQALVDLSNDLVKQQLIKQFTNGETIISSSFKADRAAVVSVPAVGAESTDGKAKLTSATTFSISAIAKSELETYLKYAIGKQINNAKTQRIYDDGVSKVVLSGYNTTDSGAATINIATTGQIGPNIDQAAIKKQVAGKRYGDIQSLLGGIDGVNNVDVKFSYFWVNTVPNDINKIDIQFILQNA
jgi:hypothetical protein